jgi:hypothetical protein
MQKADSVPGNTGIHNSSSMGPSIHNLENTAHDLRLLLRLFPAAANSTSSSSIPSGGSSGSSSSSTLDAAGTQAAADAGGTKQLQLSGMVQLVAFCIFEVLIGMFWPSMMTLRAKYVPEQQRSTIINVFRIPLNLFVCLILWKVRSRFGSDAGREEGGGWAGIGWTLVICLFSYKGSGSLIRGCNPPNMHCQYYVAVKEECYCYSYSVTVTVLQCTSTYVDHLLHNRVGWSQLGHLSGGAGQ